METTTAPAVHPIIAAHRTPCEVCGHYCPTVAPLTHGDTVYNLCDTCAVAVESGEYDPS